MILFLSKCAKKLDEGLDFPNSCLKGYFFMFKSPFFQFSAIVLIYKVGLTEMFTSDAEKKKTKQKNFNGRRWERRPLV